MYTGTKKAFECTQCDASFSVAQMLKKHIRSVHQKLKLFTCSTCSSSFAEKSNLIRHVLSVHEGVKPHECEICHGKYESRQYLQQHIESVHERKKPHICSMCGANFGHRSHLYKHAREKHGVQTDDYKAQFPYNSHIMLDGHPIFGDIKQEEEQEANEVQIFTYLENTIPPRRW